MPSRVSVALASYNGALYIREQLASILNQLGENDEIVVVDDASSDETVPIICSFVDARIHLHTSTVNNGVIESFSKAIALCTGDILFLADQDDIWLAGKVQAVLDVFDRDRSVNIVITDATVIDASGHQILGSYYSNRGGFTDSLPQNLIKSRFHGCLMAFRAELKGAVLPLAPYHDVWIGLCNKIIGGRAEFIATPYIAYRRHGNNESSPLRWNRKLTKRLGLLANLLWRLPRLRNAAFKKKPQSKPL